ncbi:MAG: DUF1292 domain-containing protein [Bacillota bacterium]
MTMEDEDMIVVFTDDDGNEFYYREDFLVEIDDKKFAVLVSISEDDEEDCGCDDDDCDCGGDTFIARIEPDEKGEEIYVDPTDEEFEMVREAYEEYLAEEDEEE